MYVNNTKPLLYNFFLNKKFVEIKYCALVNIVELQAYHERAARCNHNWFSFSSCAWIQWPNVPYFEVYNLPPLSIYINQALDIVFIMLLTLVNRLINPVVVAPTIAAVGLSFYSYGFPLVGKCIEIGVVQILLVVIFALVSLFKLLLTAFEK